MDMNGNKTNLGALVLAVLVLAGLFDLVDKEVLTSLVGLDVAWLIYAGRDALKKLEK